MIKSYKYRLYPTHSQAELINKHIGACRFVYNLALETKNNAYATHGKRLSVFELMRQLTDLKNECEWLREVDSQALQQSLLDLERSFTGFFKGYSSFPSFKKKCGNESFRNPHGRLVSIKGDTLIQPKFRKGIKIKIDRIHVGEIRSTTISRTSTGKYYVSVLCETGVTEPIKPNVSEQTSVGVDLGLSHFAITSNGEKIDNPKHLRASIKRLKVLQRRLSRKKKGSSNRKKAAHKVALLHERVSNQRKDFLHKASTKLIRENQTICLEDLSVSNMVKNHKLALSISDAGWGIFTQMIEYKSAWNGRNLLKIPRFEPSTKLCSNCGKTKHGLTLKDRDWTCECGAHHDRDINAAINIKNYCIRNSGRGIPAEPLELPTLVGALKKEVNL